MFLHTECRGESRFFLFITDCRIFFLFLLHTESRGGHELSNYRIFFTRSVAEGHGGLLFSDYRIVSSHGMTRKVTNYRIIELFLHTLDNVYILGFSDVYKALRDKRLRSCQQPVFQNGDGRAGVCLSATKKTHGAKKIMLWECSFVSPALHHIMMVISLFLYKGIKIF